MDPRSWQSPDMFYHLFMYLPLFIPPDQWVGTSHTYSRNNFQKTMSCWIPNEKIFHHYPGNNIEIIQYWLPSVATFNLSNMPASVHVPMARPPLVIVFLQNPLNCPSSFSNVKIFRIQLVPSLNSGRLGLAPTPFQRSGQPQYYHTGDIVMTLFRSFRSLSKRM